MANGKNIGDLVWRRPVDGWIKVNTDAALFNNISFDLESVIQSSQGAFLGARSWKVDGAWHPREAEAIGLKEAPSCVIGRKLGHCIIETDCQVLADALVQLFGIVSNF